MDRTVERRAYRAHTDIVLILLVAAMSLMGIVAVCVATYSPASSPDISFLNHVVESSYTMRQCLFVLVAPLVVGFLMVLPYDFLFRRTELIYWIMVVLLAVVTVFNRAQGVKAWLDIIWGYTIQPSEFAKLSMILILAKQLSRSNRPMATPKSFMRVMITVMIPSVIILAEGETGSMLVIVALTAVMMYFSGVSLKLLGILAGIAMLGILSLYGIMVATGSTDYRLARISGFLNPELYSSSDSYQILQSQMAIGSGGLTGIGMFVDGSISQLNYVPADWTDFIYATIGEAWGFVGCMTVLVMYFLILLRMLYLAFYTRDKFGRLVICGVLGMLLFHVFENIAMTLGLMPITGIPLPFLSYGGSNMVTNMGGIGLVLNVTRNRSLSDAVSTPQTWHNPYRYSTKFKTRPW
ncbi:MAG: rod shape-determining protein RodA [Clostridia bacterium]|nr:rod shape-determining protein RodA [Clostridia bacterium]MBR2601285.1 rod shape-determining protein RodA [Clostridia bacterium]MBR7173961.1 rod shape-determining protein RodA [Clostridia bacterium]